MCIYNIYGNIYIYMGIYLWEYIYMGIYIYIWEYIYGNIYIYIKVQQVVKGWACLLLAGKNIFSIDRHGIASVSQNLLQHLMCKAFCLSDHLVSWNDSIPHHLFFEKWHWFWLEHLGRKSKIE